MCAALTGTCCDLREVSFAITLASDTGISRSQPNVDRIDVTRPWRDGGRDAVGDYLLGPRSDPVAVEFALEAKCYAPTNSVGVRETSRLISRRRHRQFAVLVTTSYIHAQAYQEIREDGHPVVIPAGRDLVSMLKSSGIEDHAAVRRLLAQN
jgi:Restriction endonuclease